MSEPQAPEEQSESTLLSLGLGLVLAIVLGAANVYLGLYAGMTVSASIPAAVVSMAVLRGAFKRGTLLENNIAQTVASTGESLAAGAIFTLPALIIAGVWDQFDFWISTGIVLMGGLLGIVFMVPLRKALIVDRPDLRYPEGVACAEVLRVGQGGAKTGIRAIAIGLGLGALFKFLVSGMKVLSGTVEHAWFQGQRVFYMGADMSPALLAVGYIVGLGVACQIFLGGVIGWIITIPFAGPYYELESANALDYAWTMWSTEVRYLGVGAMLVGGLASIWNVRAGLVAGVRSLQGARATSSSEDLRTERNISFQALLFLLVFTIVGTLILYYFLIHHLGLAFVALLVMIPAAFLFAAVATYIVGLVGSSNSPVSGMTICAVLMAAIVISLTGGSGAGAILATLGVAGVVCCVACTAGDVAQDLKTGQLVGATPARQQWAEVLGVVIPALTMAPVLTLLHSTYTIGSKELLAPQATLFASLVSGFFGEGSLPYPMIIAGMGVGAGILLLDAVLQAKGLEHRLHVMPIAVGIYLPLALSVPIVLGGLLHTWISGRQQAKEENHGGLLFGSGLIAGEALMGIGLAVPATLGINLAINMESVPPILRAGVSMVLFLGIVGAFYVVAGRRKGES